MDTEVALFDTRCDACSKTAERRGSFIAVEADPCDCGGSVKVFFDDLNLSMDATPTRGYGRTKTHPALVNNDGSQFNPGHNNVTTDMLRLKPEQVKRLDL
jgi:hypothetical protein